MNKLFNIHVYTLENEKTPITVYKSKVAPQIGDDVKCKDALLHISHREFNSDKPEFIKVFGYTEDGF